MTAGAYAAITACRVCGTADLVTVLSLGMQALTGVFPRSPGSGVTAGPLELAWCARCGLLQLRDSYDPNEMYGENYGYRSGLNRSMISHLEQKTRQLEQLVDVRGGAVVLDIGSNDGTLLKSYRTAGLEKIGIDPTAAKFKEHYTPEIQVVTDFFSAAKFRAVSPRRAKIVTSIAMFYDLESPAEFAREVAEILDDDGVWHFEQSYMPSMLRMNSYDTICHEHLEYYSLAVIRTIVERADLRIVDVQMNAVNGGSF